MTDTALASVAQLGAFLGETLADTDPSAQLYLSIASGMVRDYLHQQVTEETDEVILVDPIDGSYVMLPELPVSTVSLVETFDGTAWATADPSAYTVSKRLGMIAGKPGYVWPSGPESWRVTYSHGFNAVPDSIVGVVLGVAARAYSSPVAVDSERIGGYQVKYAIESAGFSPLEQVALSRYKLARIA